jgi:uncharacterized radical SAM superfamily Fe-S cluster-containing enzyme
MSAVATPVSRAVSNGAWLISKSLNSILPNKELPRPIWAPGRLPKSWQRAPMPTGVPRKTLSLCPDCNREAVEAVVNGEMTVAEFRDRPGIIEAEIVDEAGRILMRKACVKHGPFEDVLSNHPAFFRRMESLAFGRDFDCSDDGEVHNHGANGIRRGRGTYLIVDLTNRCNMVCSPCYMDANGTSFVHELDVKDVKAIFERAASFKPQREINVLFSGGEATLSPIFLDAIRHAKSVGFHRLHVTTNGIRFAQDNNFAVDAREAGLHGVYLQFDGTTEEKNKHRGIGNYVEVKCRALENIAAAGMKTTLQVSVMNGVNNDGIGAIVRFVAENVERIHGVIFQPIMFCGRDENVAADERYIRRYPVSQIAYDLQSQTSMGWEPLRDWFPVSAYGAFAHLCDAFSPGAELGSLFNDIHPDHGIFSPVLMNARTAEMIPVATFFNVGQLIRDVMQITDSWRGSVVAKSLLSVSVVRNFRPDKAPAGFGLRQIRDLLEDCFYRIAGSGEHWSHCAYSYKGPWKLVMVSAMIFQDLYNYDLSTISDSTTPVATQEGEINFCAYNGGRWRKVVENLHQTAELASWHRAHPRHQIYAKGKHVQLGDGSTAHLVQIESEGVTVQA